MKPCKCGSYAINPHLHNRHTGIDLDLCDVCYWHKRTSKMFFLYVAVNEMVAYLGAKGEINTRSALVSNVMDALHEIDEGAPVTELEELP